MPQPSHCIGISCSPKTARAVIRPVIGTKSDSGATLPAGYFESKKLQRPNPNNVAKKDR